MNPIREGDGHGRDAIQTIFPAVDVRDGPRGSAWGQPGRSAAITPSPRLIDGHRPRGGAVSAPRSSPSSAGSSRPHAIRILDRGGGGTRTDGLPYRDRCSAGLFLAGIRNIKPRPVGFKFHAVMVINSAHLLGQTAPVEDRLLAALLGPGLPSSPPQEPRTSRRGTGPSRPPSKRRTCRRSDRAEGRLALRRLRELGRRGGGRGRRSALCRSAERAGRGDGAVLALRRPGLA